MNKISSSDRASLIRLASSLPAGDETRKAILAGLAKISSSKQSSVKIRRFVNNDWSSWAGAVQFSDGSDPFIADLSFRGDLSGEIEFGEEEGYAQNTQEVIAISDAEGIGLHFSSDDGDQGPSFYDNSSGISPEEAEETLESVLRTLSSGRLPNGFKQMS